MAGQLEVIAPDDAGEIRAGDDLVQLLGTLVTLRDGDIVLVTSKAVAKAEGRVFPGERTDVLDRVIAEEVAAGGRVLASRGGTSIVRTRHGVTLAAAGIDNSNVEPGSHVLLPLDPDASARRLRARFAEMEDVDVAVVVTDTAGRPWREGQTDIAIGVAGLRVVDSHAGRVDPYGNPLEVTAPAVADELAGAAELAQGKTSGRPFAVVRGRADLVLPPGVDGPGAIALVRRPGGDMFGLGTREAVVAALAGDGSAFGAPAPAGELVAALAALGHEARVEDGAVVVPVPGDAGLAALGVAHGWRLDTPERRPARFLPPSP